ncbi:MAG TPA: endolytic transglycosylase MltG [Bacteroidales bacterium]|nr:endolytic transglycosylase MltG [Bacteroidales bacterium]HRZ48993.1 endolytic transglycosylase MltG [Bacteroidales bacterium]
MGKLYKKLWIYILAALALCLAVAATGAFFLLAPNVKRNIPDDREWLFVAPRHTMDDVTASLERNSVLRSDFTFKMVADWSGSGDLLRPGRYRLLPGMSNYRILQKLRNGLQEPVRFTFNNIDLPEEFAGIAGKAFHFDSLQMLEAMKDPGLEDSMTIKPEMLLGHFLPNTYEIYWTISPEKLIARLVSESEKFWTDERNRKLAERNLTRDQVLIIASIVQKETNHTDEMSRIAGVYINRLKTGMKLQADPTVKFAVGQPGLRRIRHEQLVYASPYNTYYTEGLPPGVICAPEPETIDRVLAYEEHQYLYFCAEPGYNSRHTFAVTGKQHMQNAAKYRAWLRRERIY